MSADPHPPPLADAWGPGEDMTDMQLLNNPRMERVNTTSVKVQRDTSTQNSSSFSHTTRWGLTQGPVTLTTLTSAQDEAPH